MAPKKRSKPEPIDTTEEDKLPGVIYIGHIPHGFYEAELKSYFTQFGRVLNVKVSRSKKTGKSKGYAFVKFQYAAVAKTVADTCHNYLFYNKLLKCEYRPLDQVHKDTFYNYYWKDNLKPKRLHNSAKTDDKVEKLGKQSEKRQSNKLKKLQEMGVDIQLDDVVTINKTSCASAQDEVSKAISKEESSADTEEAPSPAATENSVSVGGSTARRSKRKREEMETSSPKKTVPKKKPAAVTKRVAAGKVKKPTPKKRSKKT